MKSRTPLSRPRVAVSYMCAISPMSAWAQEEHVHTTRFNGARAVFITANQRDGQNVFAVRDGIMKQVQAFSATLPGELQLVTGFDQTEAVAKRLNQLGMDFLIAVSLVLLTLLPLGLRAALVVMFSIPMSLALGIWLLHYAGFTLNQLSISGFVLSLGLLVDDSIVVVENIARHLRMGKTPVNAAIEGTQTDLTRGGRLHGDADAGLSAAAVPPRGRGRLHPLAAGRSAIHRHRLAVRVADDHSLHRQPRAEGGTARRRQLAAAQPDEGHTRSSIVRCCIGHWPDRWPPASSRSACLR